MRRGKRKEGGACNFKEGSQGKSLSHYEPQLPKPEIQVQTWIYLNVLYSVE